MSFEIRIQLVGSKAVLSQMNALKGFFKSPELNVVLQDSVNRMVFIAGRLAPKGLTHLLSQVYGKLEGFGSADVQMVLKSPAKYAKYVEFPTKPHMITPVRRKVLFWTDYSGPGNRMTFRNPNTGIKRPVGAVFHFAQQVQHPGTKAQPFLRPAVEQVQPRMVQAIRRVLRDKLKGTA